MPPGQKPPPAKKTPASRVIAPQKPIVNDPEAARASKFINETRYPGLLRGTSDNIGDYIAFENSVASDPQLSGLINHYGAPVKALMWNAYIGVMDQNTLFNKIRAQHHDFDQVMADLNKQIQGGGGGRGRGGGGGGGGSAAPTPEQIASAKAAIKNRAATVGRPMTDDELTYVATVAVRDGWSSDQVDDWLVGDPTKVTDPGIVTATVDDIKKMAGSQLLSVSDDTAREWAMRITSGEMDPAAVQAIFQQQAIGEFGWAAQQLNAEQTMRDMLMPARDRIANELEMNPNEVDLMDSKWRNMVTVPDANGQPRAATLTEVTRNARKDPAFAKTTGAVRGAAATFRLIQNTFEGG